MNVFTKCVVVAAVIASFSLAALNAISAGNHSHSHSHGETAEFAAVNTQFGTYQPGMTVDRTIEIGMADDMSFTPNKINVKKGEVILFKHTNHGKLIHEFVLGTLDTLSEHSEMMKEHPNMKHEEPYMVHVAPGESGTIIWKFSETGEFAFGCLLPGHYEAGMRGTISVAF